MHTIRQVDLASAAPFPRSVVKIERGCGYPGLVGMEGVFPRFDIGLYGYGLAPDLHRTSPDLRRTGTPVRATDNKPELSWAGV
jgi:hypothetical protein